MTGLDEVIAAWLRARDAGHAPSRAELLAAHPQLAEGLGSFLDDVGRADDWVAAFALPEFIAPGTAHDKLPTRAPAALGPLRYFGDYEIVDEIARGGMGVVYRARQVSLNRAVALKMIASGLLQNEKAVRRFQFEAEAAAGLDHPGIVPIHEIGEHEGQHYFSMQLVEGQALDTAAGAFVGRPEQAAALLRDVCEAVAHGHRRGVLHRDLKPGNILLDPDGKPHVTDFGLAKRLDVDDGLTRTGDLMGTPTHMAPEQAVGGEVTTATDVWSLGVVLYELLTGCVPFRGANVMETLRLLKEEQPVPPTRDRPGVPRDLETICLKCLEKNPERRYADAGDLAADLRRFSNGEPIEARPVGTLERAWKWARRRPAVAGLAGFGVLALLGTLTAAVLFADYQRRVADAARDLTDEARAQRRSAIDHARLASERETEAQDLAYASGIALAARAWEDGDVLSLDALLQAQVPADAQADRRGFEWRFLEARRSDARVLEANGGYVSLGEGVLLAPSRSDAQWMGFRDPVSGAVLAEVRGYERRIGSLPLTACVSADGTLALTAGSKYVNGRSYFAVRLWDMVERSLAGSLEIDVVSTRDAVLALSSDGSRLAVYDGRRGLEIRDTRSGRVLTEITDLVQANGIRFFDGQLEYVRTVKRGDEHRLALVRRTPGAEPDTIITDFEYPGAWYELSAVAWSPDGALVALGTFEGTIAVIETSSGVTRHARRLHNGYVHALAFSPDGMWLASGGVDGLTRMTHVRTGRAAPPLRGTGESIQSLVFVDDRRLAGATFHHLLIWDRAETPEDWTIEQFFLRGQLCFADAHEPTLANFSGLRGELWSLERGGKAHALATGGGGHRLASTPSGHRFAVLSFKGRLDLWAPGEDQPRQSTELHLAEDHAVELAIAPAGDVVAVGQIDFGVRFFSTETGKELRVWKSPRGGQGAMVFSPDGRKLAICGNGEEAPLALIDVATATRLHEFGLPDTWNTSPVFSADGTRFATVCRPASHYFARVTVWDAESLAVISRSSREREDIEQIVFHPDGRTLAGARANGEIFFVHVPTGFQMLALQAHRSPVADLAFSPDGATLWSASRREIRAWRTSPRR